MKYYSLLAILACRILIHPPAASVQNTPFTSFHPQPAFETVVPAKVIRFEGKIEKQKVLLNWTVSENQTADQFAVEKSFDGKHFEMAALVFSSDDADTGNYAYYERSANQKVQYRIRVVNKNRETVYSSVIEINPHVG